MASRGPSSTALPVAIAMASLILASLPTLSQGICPARCRCNDTALIASCVSGSLDVVPIQLNPEIRHLDLSGNRVVSVHHTFDFYGNLKTLNLASNFIHTLGSHNFKFQSTLTSLNLSSNVIKNITKNALRGLKLLRDLDLSSNNITEMEELSFHDTNELEYLNLSGNSMTSLPDDLLKSLPLLRTLLLSRNVLLEVPTGNLALVKPTLEILDLSSNLIEELVSGSLPSMNVLTFLNLADNGILRIANDAFDQLPNLKILDLSGNKLTSVPTVAISRLNVLTTLTLNGNPLESLHSVAFQNLFELKNLELNNCSIADVHPRAFADNVNLERISMDGNRDLRVLPARVLYGARYLRWVSLRHCSLATLQPTQFPVDGLSSLRVGHNPLVCNCSVHWLWNVLRAEERRNETRLDLDVQDIVCVDEEFIGKSLISLPEGSLRCRLSPLYLSLSAAGCLAATATILALIVHVTRSKRRKRPAYTAPNRPELLVYVGRGNNELDKNAESYSRRLIAARNEELLYETPRRKTSQESLETTARDATNVYETPRYSRPNRRDRDPYERRQIEEGVYAVADVTGLARDEPPEVLSLYRMRTPSSLPRPSAPSVRNYDYEYDYEPTIPQKPHVVFV